MWSRETRLTRAILALTLLWLSASCALPGMALKTSPKTDGGFFKGVSAETEEGQPEIPVYDIDADLIVNQHRYRSSTDAVRTAALELTQATLEKKIEKYVYRIGANDILNIIVWGHPELTSPEGEGSSGREVRSDGTIFFPFVGVVPVQGKTVEQVRMVLTRKMQPYIKQAQIDVRVAEYRSRQVWLAGEVAAPGAQFIGKEPPTLFSMLNQAGGVTESADPRLIRLSRDGEDYTLDVSNLYEFGNPGADIMLRAGDVVTVPNNRATRIFMLGEVGEQRTVPMVGERMSLADAIVDSGGFDISSANLKKVYVIRSVADSIEENTIEFARSERWKKDIVVFQLDARSPEAFILADQFDLAPRDIVFVATNKFVRVNRLLNQILPSVQTLLLFGASSRVY